MGVAAENVAARFGISRERQDELALRSHRRALASAAAGIFDAEIVPLPGVSGPDGSRTASADDGPRRGLTAAVLARFPPVFAAGGTVTAGNSCFDADGAAAVVITSVQRARELGATDGLLVRGTDTAGVDPQLLGIGAAAAAERPAGPVWRRRRGAGAGRVQRGIRIPDHCVPGPARHPAGTRQRSTAAPWPWATPTVRPAQCWSPGCWPRHAATRSEGQLALALISIAGGMGTAALLEYRSFP